MPKYNAEETLTKEGKVFSVGSVIELTEEQAKALGDKVSEHEEVTEFVQGESYDEETFRALPATEQKKSVEFYGGDLKEITNADSRWAFVQENQQ